MSSISTFAAIILLVGMVERGKAAGGCLPFLSCGQSSSEQSAPPTNWIVSIISKSENNHLLCLAASAEVLVKGSINPLVAKPKRMLVMPEDCSKQIRMRTLRNAPLEVVSGNGKFDFKAPSKIELKQHLVGMIVDKISNLDAIRLSDKGLEAYGNGIVENWIDGKLDSSTVVKVANRDHCNIPTQDGAHFCVENVNNEQTFAAWTGSPLYVEVDGLPLLVGLRKYEEQNKPGTVSKYHIFIAVKDAIGKRA